MHTYMTIVKSLLSCYVGGNSEKGTFEDINNCQSSGDAFIRVQKAAYALGLGTQQVLSYVQYIRSLNGCIVCTSVYVQRVAYN